MSVKWEAFEAAGKPGAAPCANCGWREGDGVRVCYSDPEIGPATHSNRRPTGLTAEQAALYGAYEHPLNGKIVYRDDAAKQAEIIANRAARLRRYEDSVASATRFGWDAPAALDLDAETRGFQERVLAAPVVADLPRSWGTAEYQPSKGIYFARASHPGCDGRGFVKHLGPYHYGCTGCDTEVKLWEHGIDYDVG